MHVTGSTKSKVFQPYNDNVRMAMLAEVNKDYTQWYDWIIANGIPTLIYIGEWDQYDGPVSVRSMFKGSKYYGNKVWETPRNIYYVNSTTQGMYVGGYWRADPEYVITLLTVPKMGHAALRTEVPTLKQAVGDYLLNDHKLYCHTDDLDKCLTANYMCASMYACGVNGICMYDGQCICNKGWSGADCSQKTNLLTSFYSKTSTINGTQ